MIITDYILAKALLKFQSICHHYYPIFNAIKTFVFAYRFCINWQRPAKTGIDNILITGYLNNATFDL